MPDSPPATPIRAVAPLQSLTTRVVGGLLVVVAAFVLALGVNVALQRRMLTQFTLLNESYVTIVRRLDTLRTSTQAYSASVSERDPVVLRQTLLAHRTIFPFESSVALQLDELDTHLAEVERGSLPATDAAFIANMRGAVDELRALNEAIATETDALIAALEDPERGSTTERLALNNEVNQLSGRLADLGAAVDVRTQLLLDAAQTTGRQATTRVIAIASLAALLALIVVVFVERSLRPIRRLTAAAQRLKEGDYAPTEISAGRDEVGVLAQEFGAMADAIQLRDQQLRQKNREIAKAYDAQLEAQQALVESERLAAIGEMSSRITHELRNPLSSIGLNVEMLREELEDAEVEPDTLDMLASVDAEVTRLKTLTEGYLSLARPHVGRTSPLDLRQLSREVVAQLGAELDTHRVSVAVKGDPLPVVGDAQQLRQVWINLIQNAMQAMSGHGAERRIEIETTRRGDEALVTFDDSGPGIPSDELEAIFRPFVTSRQGGTGLGLSICRRIIVEHKGTLEATSHGSLDGASFRLTLPMG